MNIFGVSGQNYSDMVVLFLTGISKVLIERILFKVKYLDYQKKECQKANKRTNSKIFNECGSV